MAKFSRGIARIGVVGAAAAALGFGFAGSSFADVQYQWVGEGDGSCSKKIAANVCFWVDNNYKGYGVALVGPSFSVPDILKEGFPVMDNKISSFVNNTDRNYCLYEKEGYGGAVMQMGPREHWASLPSWINDKGSSMKPC
ncbi:hypothetical protein CF54_18795 [Streptomyces sp. Tu 6176]|uniref:peptidase inhibitor family I36 protein n=1 Tax=Streptomyces sp. Tu 6176 TaxID=1470557 RepID=UPI0004538F65|nr:peptidase inhibitor family I36 protein [Streptomyces sp. Tu 6176]EYT81567.1 hypothetical protein CF54_18795 [Streptomyces sp. Tu 6176]